MQILCALVIGNLQGGQNLFYMPCCTSCRRQLVCLYGLKQNTFSKMPSTTGRTTLRVCRFCYLLDMCSELAWLIFGNHVSSTAKHLTIKYQTVDKINAWHLVAKWLLSICKASAKHFSNMYQALDKQQQALTRIRDVGSSSITCVGFMKWGSHLTSIGVKNWFLMGVFYTNLSI